MRLESLTLLNFKNYEQADLRFPGSVNCFVGDNGSGKTNILDAIHYLCFCKSYFNPVDSQNIRHDEQFFVVEGDFEKEGDSDHIYCAVRKGQKKVFKRNKVDYDRLAEHIGRYPAVMISPYDKDLISDGSELRRKFADMIISQTARQYLDDLIAYNKALRQRNHLLKYFWQNNTFQRDSLDVWDEQLFELNRRIYEQRKSFIDRFVPIFDDHYKRISGNAESVSIDYRSHLSEGTIEDAYADSLEKDRRKAYTHRGVHRDDLVFTIEGHPLKKFGSQGQQKSFVIALKLAQFDFIRDATGIVPVLLLDDVFDKIDDKRVKNLMELVSEHAFGQLFITDTDEGRVPQIFQEIGENVSTFKVRGGNVEAE